VFIGGSTKQALNMTFNFFEFLRCTFRGHRFQQSQSRPGMVTCRRCGWRRPAASQNPVAADDAAK